ncbi:MAG TPA: adenylate/guanylate cyclase domain-containing protein [Spirochaetota bacterium]|nr:adenylate/guanylate cyclase domain-containing protein [Spirochaetota bacterium]
MAETGTKKKSNSGTEPFTALIICELLYSLLQIGIIFFTWYNVRGSVYSGRQVLPLINFIIPAQSVLAVIFIINTANIILKLFKFTFRFLSFSASFLSVLIITLFIWQYAESNIFFSGLSLIVYLNYLLSLGWFTFLLVVTFYRSRNRALVEYNSFKKEKNITQTSRELARTPVSGRPSGPGIRFKLVSVFMLLFLFSISGLSLLLLNDYKKTINSSVIYTGTTLAEQSASFLKSKVIDIRSGNFIDLREYLSKQKKKNRNAQLPFASITFYIKNKLINSNTGSEKWQAVASTGVQLQDSLLESNLLAVFRDQEGTGLYQNDQTRESVLFAPAQLGDKIFGYSVVRYSNHIIYRSFYKAMIRVIIITFYLLYFVFFLVYILGSRIVKPLTYLQLSVKKESILLSRMLSGKERVTASQLSFSDNVTTRDEIKDLSGAIGNMFNVIKGIIPYVSQSTLKQAKKGKTGYSSSKRRMTFLFTDIRGFTTMCEGRKPQEVVSILNHYLNLQTDIITANHGDIDKFVGDEVMASFSGKNSNLNAASACVELIRKMAAENKKRKAGKNVTVRIGVGINEGEVIFGSVGAKDRLDFTSIGDTVNLAARLEGANKQYYTSSLISEAVYNKIKQRFLCREIDLLTVKGKSRPVKVYEIISLKKKATNADKNLVREFNSALKFYRKKNWKSAEKKFNEIYAKYSDQTSSLFLKRIALYRKSPPPAKWNGVYQLTVK